jgi:hypothetical protein
MCIHAPQQHAKISDHKDALGETGIEGGQRVVFVGLRRGAARIRCIWGSDGETGIEGSQRKRLCLMVARIRSNFLSVVGLRYGTIMVAKIRRNFCKYRMLWERLG